MVKNAYVFFEDGHLRVKFQLKTGGADRFGTDWHEVQLEPGSMDRARSTRTGKMRNNRSSGQVVIISSTFPKVL